MSEVVIGIDPSSKKLALVITIDDKLEKVYSRPVPTINGIGRAMAFSEMFIIRVVKGYRRDGHTVHVFIEDPFISPKTVRAVLPLARINGALHGAVTMAGGHSHEVTIQSWKKTVVGNGGAGKPLVTATIKKLWPTLWEKWHDDQDVMDAGGINMHGQRMLKLAKHQRDNRSENG